MRRTLIVETSQGRVLLRAFGVELIEVHSADLTDFVANWGTALLEQTVPTAGAQALLRLVQASCVNPIEDPTPADLMRLAEGIWQINELSVMLGKVQSLYLMLLEARVQAIHATSP